jgi:hypothetical protein
MPITLKQKSVEEMKKGIFAPKDKEKDEKSESGMKKGGKVKKMAMGGYAKGGAAKKKMPAKKAMKSGGKC